MHRRIDVAESELVSRDLPVRMHVPFAQEQHELILGKGRVHFGEGDHVERVVPGRVPGKLPVVRHRKHVAVIKMHPAAVAAVPALRRRGADTQDRPAATPERRSYKTAWTKAGWTWPGGRSSVLPARRLSMPIEQIGFEDALAKDLVELDRTPARPCR